MKVVVVIGVATLVLAAMGSPPGRGQARVDFARDVQPLLKERCFECHGPTKQMNGYRLDRRSVALAGITRPNIVPRSSDSSRLYRRVVSPEFGTQMPPDDPLAQDEIEVIKRWIDEGAEWPDAFANDQALPPQDPMATRITELIRASNHQSALDSVRRTPSSINGRGPGGSTPLMYAVLYGGAKLVGDLLKAGADPNVRNDAGATGLSWAVDDIEKVELLLAHGADVNAATNFGRTPVMLSAQAGSAAVVKLLLERGASPNSAALASAAARGDVAIVRLLVGAGARDNNGAAAAAALRANCRECLDAIVGRGAAPIDRALLSVLPIATAGDPDAIREAIQRGADVNAKDAKGRTVLMLAAISETLPASAIEMLLERGADATLKDGNGLTALDFAKRLGHTSVVDALVKRGVPSLAVPDATFSYVQGNTVRAAVARSVPLLQRTAVQFYEKSACVSCHHNALTAMTVAAARSKGFAVDESTARHELRTVVKDVEATREQALQGIVSPGGFVTTIGYILLGLSAERHPRGDATDAMVRLLKTTQLPDGRWRSPYRPPSEASEFTATTVSMRGIQLYGRGVGKRSDAEAIRAATSWLERAQPRSTEDRAFRLLGLTWARSSNQARQAAIRNLVETQRQDGGWAQLPSMKSDAYATGQVLVALYEAGVPGTDAVYRRGVQFLLNTQLGDGSWFVKSRSHPTQIFFESGFPHGQSQFISAAATNWATRALILSENGRSATQASVLR